MRPVALVALALFLMCPAMSEAAVPDAGLRGSLPDFRLELKKKGKKGKKGRKGKKGKKDVEEAPPPPPPDGDGDGIPDADDGCAEVAEDLDGWEDADGCPDEDNDEDGVVDASDQCPDEAENADGWDDEDGCPEPAPAITPMTIDLTLVDGTRIKGKLIRIVAVDEDEATSKPVEPTEVGIIVNDLDEFETPWSNIRSMSSEKMKFADAVDCYSEGVQELGEEMTWECTLKHPTRVTLGSTDKRGTHRILDRKMQRLDLSIDELSCTGEDCETVEADRGLSLYLYKLIAFDKGDDDGAVVLGGLQTKLRAMQKRQVKKATFSPAE